MSKYRIGQVFVFIKTKLFLYVSIIPNDFCIFMLHFLNVFFGFWKITLNDDESRVFLFNTSFLVKFFLHLAAIIEFKLKY